eukprot:evm.model.scf_911.5 EVM.evm.TU.scf_911.5   scf_911:49818-50828(+)
MSQNPRSGAPTAGGMGQRPRALGAPGERLKGGHAAPRPGAGPFHGAFHPPPPYPPAHAGLRAFGGHAGGGVPPPPPYPPPYLSQGYYYSMVPHGPSPAFEVESGVGAARGYGYGYGYAPPPPPGMPAMGGPHPMYSGYTHPTGHGMPGGNDSGVSKSRAGEFGGKRGARRDARPAPPPGPPPSAEARAEGEAANTIGLPIRPGKPDCKHFLSRGWCSYGRMCKYNHPEVAPGQQQQQPARAVAPGVMGMMPNPWMQYPMYGWPVPAGSEGSMYAAGWPPSAVMYYAPAPPPIPKADKRYPQPPSYSARSSDSAASTSSRMGDRDGLPDHKGGPVRR